MRDWSTRNSSLVQGYVLRDLISRRALLAATILTVTVLGTAVPLSRSALAGTAYMPGIDVSHWQGVIDWQAVKAAGVRYVFAKATESTDWVDPRYAANKAGAEAAGIAFGAYHYAQPGGGTADAVAEADHFIDTAGLRGRNLLPVLDLENESGLSPRALRRWARAWLNRVEERLGVRAIIYSGFYFWRDEVGNPKSFALNGHRLWVPRYGADQPLVPAGNWAGNGWTIWQHTNTGSVSGIKGNVDRDWYAGSSLASLRIKNNR